MIWISQESTEPIDVPITAPSDPTGEAVTLAFTASSVDPGDTWVNGSWVDSYDTTSKKAMARATVLAGSLAPGVYWVFVNIGGGSGPLLRSGQMGVY